jgi:hypothetical protein
MSNYFYGKACVAILFAVCFHAHGVYEVRKSRQKSLTGKSHKIQINVKKNIFIKKINGYDIEYDLYYPYQDPQDGVDSIVLYAKREKSRTMLLSEPIGENYLDEVSVKYFLSHPFIYIESGDSHGDIYGELNSLSFSPVKLELVSELPLRYPAKVPEGYYLNKNYGIRIEGNDRIFYGKIYRNDTIGDLGYTIDVEYKMLKAGNSYKLKPIKQTVTNWK